MSNITLIIIPGPGARSVSITEGMTISDLVSQQSLHGRDIIINGSGIPAAQYNNTILTNGMEVFATGSVKGNSKT